MSDHEDACNCGQCLMRERNDLEVERDDLQAKLDNLRTLSGMICEQYCTGGFLERGMHAPECWAYMFEGADDGEG